MGQFFEMRYSRSFRIFAAILQSISGVVNYAIFPAVGSRFIVYFCDLPINISVFGFVFPTFGLVMAIFLSVAVLVATKGGQITIMVTDAVQGLVSYPLYLLVVGYLIYRFSWFNEIAPSLLDRPPGQSLLNPFDIEAHRDFNLFFVLVGMLGGILNRMGWSGTQGYNAAALNAHEQKMGGVLGTWRSGFSGMMYVLLAVVALTFLTNAKFNDGPSGALACRTELATKALNDIVSGEENAQVRQEVTQYINTGEVTPAVRDWLNQSEELRLQGEAEKERIRLAGLGAGEQEVAVESPIVAPSAGEEARAAREARILTARDSIKAVDPSGSQTFFTIFGQMRVPMALRYILPIGITGAFCALCVFLLISTDTTYMHSWGSIIVQDLILPLRRKPFTPKQQLRVLRLIIVGVALFAFLFSFYFGQVDYIQMFFAITGLIWLGGSGPCIVGGLYWSRGTTAGAWVALIVGSSMAVGGFLGQQMWVETIYPWLLDAGLLGTVTAIVEGASAPFEPYILWRVGPDKFPINSQEMYAITMFLGLGLYIVVSLLTCREPFNMDRMLHRGKYKREGDRDDSIKRRLTPKAAFLRLIGINEEYSRGDKILTWSVFIYSFGWGFLIQFVVVAVWNVFFGQWSNEGWANWFFIQNIVIAGAVALVSTIWFSIGTTIDLKKLFRRLREKEVSVLDDGRVIGNVSADDIALVEQVENKVIDEAHREEAMLEDALESEDDAADIENLHKHQKPEDKDA
ncbi:MAG: hypothetical protein JW936_08990 [Sedimentisphaerales bacterium]|nr:hypothetical protein [Sedimentisphaerales bacterium]